MSQFKSGQAGIVLNCPQLFEELGILGGSDGKESSHNVEDIGLITGLGRSPEEGNGNPLQYSCLEDSMDKGAWWATIHGVTESDMTEQLTFSLHLPCSISGLREFIQSVITGAQATAKGKRFALCKTKNN